jgi:predicted membrane-bound spermidine synthase
LTTKSPSLRYLYLTVFMGGLTTLGIELSASRLLGSVFGASNIVWANIIGLILLYLTVGYFIGGRVADRNPNTTMFYRLVAWGAFTAGLVPLAARPILMAAAAAVEQIDAAVLLGSFGGTLILFAAPVTLLGMVSPFAIRLAIRDTSAAGQIAGRMYAISTIGSLVGTFLPVLVLIPSIGTRYTFLLFAGTLLAVGLAGLWMSDRKVALRFLWMPVVLAVLVVLTSGGGIKPPPAGTTLLYEDESAYNYIQVVRWGQANVLLLNEGLGLHSIYYPDHPDFLQTGGTWDHFLVAPFFNAPPFAPEDVTSMAMIGLAGGTVSKQYTMVFGPIPIDGIEIDPAIVDVGREYFAMNEPNLNVIVQDGRYALAHSPRTYDVVVVDAYRLPYIPWHMTTREFFQEIYDHLNARGAVAINVGRTVNDRRLIAALAGTMGAVFPSVHVIDVPETCNSIVVATVQPTEPDYLLANLEALGPDASPLLAASLASAYEHLQPTPEGGPVFTDDRAAVEQLTDSVLINFVMSGSTEVPCQ